MKNVKLFSIIAAVICAVAVVSIAESWNTYDMTDYGTTASITNDVKGSSTVTYALITYDAAITNTMAIYVTKGGVDYLLGTASITNGQYDSIDLVDIEQRSGGILKITTTETNVNVTIKSE